MKSGLSDDFHRVMRAVPPSRPRRRLSRVRFPRPHRLPHRGKIRKVRVTLRRHPLRPLKLPSRVRRTSRRRTA